MAAGTVKWFNDTSGYGFITPDQGGDDLYVREGSIVGAGRIGLSAGERVEFESRVAGMVPEAIGVLRVAPEPELLGGESGRLIVFGSNVQPRRRVRQKSPAWACACSGPGGLQPGYLACCPVCGVKRYGRTTVGARGEVR